MAGGRSHLRLLPSNATDEVRGGAIVLRCDNKCEEVSFRFSFVQFRFVSIGLRFSFRF